ncbi:CRISPR-associated endonuclease Cas2 [Brevibacillus laterosporus]|uniref:CRISPR-associated endonuclease Cas2 n=1 Tax=Brevibacillus laterosporus TaxID=1465 RepID=UPI0018CCB698|nr:CRISPR-associated endonuclease Cas2 [Brevibacillus laterosporus]MCR8940388.1 CRISPR-associated endonuclease Cas2 [Brevibacillus laterosporus]MCZ0843027.1 CRISPR-associated endonuclease Cas2 [Brevibacillus laterosporus]MCZ0847372.1 CRISPR-associated endonuclease Cas2 [Brevibacillus laterosporus]MED1909542.1 CRISPR-associated endonuclease Cas2 [Brevibacillus laterosporus]
MSKYMRILVFFDLPVKRKQDRKAYCAFRKFLIADGYDMLQFSVYSRICNGKEGTHNHLERLSRNLPSKGSVRSLIITEKQYEKMKFFVGKPKIKEEKVNSVQLTFF